MIGSSTGKQYEEDFDVEIGNHVVDDKEGDKASRKPAGESKSAVPITPGATIDRGHHVPLVASALTDKDGQMYGMAIDHRIPPNPRYEKHLWNHEAYENDYMNDLVKNGMSSQDAYHKAHDWSTARESAAVTAEYGEKGLEDYKQHWRDAASIAAEPTDRPRHPDAHTTKHGLDEAELGREFGTPPKGNVAESTIDVMKHALPAFASKGLFGVAKEAGLNPPGESLSHALTNPDAQTALGLFGGINAKTAASAEKWWAGAEGKPRFEIPDINSRMKPAFRDIHTQTMFDPIMKLNEVFHHPELFKAYPELKDIQVYTMPARYPNTIAGVSVDSKTIYLSNMGEEATRSALLHEIQHIIQRKEGFIQGASPRRMNPYVDEALRRTKQYAPSFERTDAAYEAYRNVSGEVESRNVQTRRDFNEYERAFRSPRSTEDVPRSRQLNAPK
jgi:hypothetical protein